jgi:hypothetical protein
MEVSSQFHILATSSLGTGPRYQLDRKVDWNQRQSEVMVKGTILLGLGTEFFVDSISYIILRGNDVIFF